VEIGAEGLCGGLAEVVEGQSLKGRFHPKADSARQSVESRAILRRGTPEEFCYEVGILAVVAALLRS
jgi:hypothetical protein